MVKKRKTYTEEFKVEAVKLVLEQQQSLTETAKNLGVGLSSLNRWKANYLKANGQSKLAFPGKGMWRTRFSYDFASIGQLHWRL